MSITTHTDLNETEKKLNYYILMPPSESKKQGGDLPEITSFSDLNHLREDLNKQLIEYINTFEDEDIIKTFKISKERLDYLKQVNSLNKNNCMPAIERFQGVMYKAINYKALTNFQKNNLDSHVLIIDALYGLLKPLDQIQEYKLMMGTRIKGLNTAKYWKEGITKKLKKLENNTYLIDLLPKAHKAAINLNELDNIVSIQFYEIKNDHPKNSGHKSKKLKGELIQYIIQHKQISLKLLKEFKHSEGHQYSNELSSEKEIIYLKK